ncbi:MAG: hypothetical protein Q4D90_00960 [bacterium]|nr:hypothetical protein [bacterium]
MSYVYLGFLDVLQNILRTIFDKVLSPVLKTVFNVLLNFVGELIWTMLSSLLADLFIILLKAVNFLNNMFSIFSGLGVVKYNGKDTSLIQYVFQLRGLSMALMVMTVMGAALAFIFAIYSTGKSMAESPFDENAFPITTVLKNGFRSAITFMIVPFMSVCILQLSTVVLDQTVITFNAASGNSSNVSGMDDVLFLTAAQDAVKENNNKSEDEILEEYSSKHRYADRDDLEDNFELDEINYLIGFTSCLLVIFILMCSCLEFIRRIFDVLLLYLVSPFFSATIALDGGIRFKKWQNLFVGKFFSGFGAIFAMQVYIMLAPTLMSSSLQLSSDKTIDMILKMFFVIGGAWAVFKGQHMVLQILSPELANAGMQSSGVAMGVLMGGAGSLGRGVSSLASTVGQKRAQAKSSSANTGTTNLANSSSGGSGQSQAFRGGKG